MKKLLLYSAAASGLLVASAAQAAVILPIDDFTDPLIGNTLPGLLQAQNGAAVFDRSTGLGIIDGDREVLLTHGDVNNGTVISAQVTGGSYTHQNGTSSGTSLLRWDGAGLGDTDGLNFLLNGGAGYDLSAAGLAFHISVNFADLAGGNVELRLYTDATNYSVRDVTLFDGPSDHYLEIALFDGAAGEVGSLDLQHLHAIELEIDGGAGLDISLNIVEAVPEPLSVGLFGLGLLGLAGARRRRAA